MRLDTAIVSFLSLDRTKTQFQAWWQMNWSSNEYSEIKNKNKIAYEPIGKPPSSTRRYLVAET